MVEDIFYWIFRKILFPEQRDTKKYEKRTKVSRYKESLKKNAEYSIQIRKINSFLAYNILLKYIQINWLDNFSFIFFLNNLKKKT